MQRVLDFLGHAFWGRLALVVIAALVILPGLDGPGLWEPQELTIADRAVARYEKAHGKVVDEPAPAPAAKPSRGGLKLGPGAGPAKAAEPETTPSAPPAPPDAVEPTDEDDDEGEGEAEGTPVETTGSAGPASAGSGTAAIPGRGSGSGRPPAKDRAAGTDPAGAAASTAAPACPKTPPTDDGARTLTDRMLARGTTSSGMRWPLALLGLLVVAGVAGIGFRLGSTRAGVLAGLVCLSFPLLSLQARMLTSEIGTPAGAVLIVYGLLFSLRGARGVWRIADAITSAAAVAIGCWLAFASGGVLLGVLVPVAAIAIAGALGWPAVRGLGRASVRGADATMMALTRSPRRLVGRDPRAGGLDADAWVTAVIALVATVAAIALVVVLATQLYDLRDPIPGTRALFGHSIVTPECWSTALGGVWKDLDSVNVTYDVAFEQIAFGTFPWGLAAPIAAGVLLTSTRPTHRRAGALAVAWGGGCWLATIAFQRKVGFTIYAGFPAMALAVGLWLDLVIDKVTAVATEAGDAGGDDGPPRDASVINIVVLSFLGLGVITLFKDLQTYPERLTSLLVGKDAIKYPKTAMFLHLPLKLWIVVLGALFAIPLTTALALMTGRRRTRHRWLPRIRQGLVAALVMTVVLAAFWTHVWQRRLASVLSSKEVFAGYRELAKPGDVLGIVGEMGNAPRYYAGGEWEQLAGRDRAFAFLQRTDGKRAFVMTPVTDACGIHKAAAGRPYYVVDNANARTLLLSNQLDPGTQDKNPLARMIVRTRPDDEIEVTPPSPIVFDGKLELVGWKIPATVDKGDTFQMTLVFRVIAPVAQAWKIFAHFDPDNGTTRFTADHAPIQEACAMAAWSKDDYIVDTFTVETRDAVTAGKFTVYVGFWPSGDKPRMKITSAPSGVRDKDERARLGTIEVK